MTFNDVFKNKKPVIGMIHTGSSENILRSHHCTWVLRKPQTVQRHTEMYMADMAYR